MGVPATAFAREWTPRQAVARTPYGSGGDPVGADGRRFLARSAGGVWPLADGLLPLREMAPGRPLAAHSGEASVLTNGVTTSIPGPKMAL